MTSWGKSITNAAETTLYPRWSRRLRRTQIAVGVAGAAATIAHHGYLQWSTLASILLGMIVVAGLSFQVMSLGIRYSWSRTRTSFLQQNRVDLAFAAVWIPGFAICGMLILLGEGGSAGGLSGTELMIGWSEVLTILWGLYELYEAVHQAADAGLNPAVVLVISFLALIGVGTVLLMLPRCRPVGEPPTTFLKAFFTATSASCVTGLVLDPPGTYWSRTGQIVILGMIQLGGLGIMTFSAFFALVLGRKLPVREQVTFRELLESDRIGDVSGMIRSILGFTLGIELVGALALMTLWPELPLRERFFYGVFHSVSAFCNAGFCLRDVGLLGWELKWQVWGVMPLLIILGGFGFTALDNWRRVIRYRFKQRNSFDSSSSAPPRVSLTTRMVTLTSLGLLLGGMVLLYCLERNNSAHPLSELSQLSNAWFHSVTLRTAGFNTIDHEQLRPGTKLLGIMLMFVGASPGSTGGGVKTICLALAILTLRSVLRGRPAVETAGRTIPEELVFRGLAIMTLGLTTLVLAGLLLVIIEDRPDRFVDHVYEATSAFATVGVSANLTPTLKPASHIVLIVTMFLGRVGPLTLIVALAGFTRPGGYAYPEERIALG